MSSSLRRTWGQRAVLALNTLGIVAALGLAWALDAGDDVASSINRVQLGGSLTPVEPAIDGSVPAFNVLLVGYDSAANLDPDDPVAIGRQGERLGDVIIIARIDQQAGSATLLSIPRDLWVPVPGFDDQKINSTFQLGGPSLLIETIESHLDIPINSFMSVDLAGFEGLVEVVDHVDLFFAHPSRDFNPAPASGPPRSMSGFGVDTAGCQSLDPANALAFVRSRNFQINLNGEWINDGERSDLERIRRQQLFVASFAARALDLGARNPLVLRGLVTAAAPHLTLDQELTPQGLIDIGRAFDSFDPDQLETYSLPTEFGWERNRTVSVVRTLEDEAAPVLRLLQGSLGSDPATVGVTVRTVAAQRDPADGIVNAFADEGFDIESALADVDLSFGVSVSYGRDGEAALPLVLDSLAEQGVVVDVTLIDEALPGREIVVSVGGPPPESDQTAPTATPSTPAPDPSTTEPSAADEQLSSVTTAAPGALPPADAPTVALCP